MAGDTYNLPGQAGAMGPNAHVHDNTFNQTVSHVEQHVDLAELAKQLGEWQQALMQKPSLPSAGCLPYRMDRNEQQEKLEIAIRTHCANSPNRPLICVVHGIARECPEAYLIRLEDSLPNFLGCYHPKLVEKPRVLRGKMDLFLNRITGENRSVLLWKAFDEAIRKAFDEAVTSEDTVSSDPLGAFSGLKDAMVLIKVSLLSDDFKGVALDGLNHFLEFWNQEFWDRWETLSETLLLVVCLSLQYQSHHEARRRKYTFWRSAGLNAKLRQYISILERNYGIHKNIKVVCLPELEAIRERDAKDAVSHPSVKQYCDVRESDVTKIYDQPNFRESDGRIRMQILLDQLDDTVRRRFL